MLESFMRDLQAGWVWLKAEMSRPMPGPRTQYAKPGSSKKLEPRRTRRPAPATEKHNHDEDGPHQPAYDGDAFSGDSGGDGD